MHSSLEEVLLFYKQWSSFISCRSFASADRHNVREVGIDVQSNVQAPNRFVRRAMEKENSKSREDSRKQYNATVLRLVTLCQKTDPRYTEAIEAEKKERERKEEEARKRQQEAENRRKEELRSKMETGVTKVKKLITM